ncbi:MAG: hypothetical protein QG573_818, partial [Acidobacteriota bacterium]|nr:hypothetical protein [Acidobacteriota bacterium]
LAEHQAEIAAFLAASNYRGSEPEALDPALTDEKIREATEDYLALLQNPAAEPDPPPSPPTGANTIH